MHSFPYYSDIYSSNCHVPCDEVDYVTVVTSNKVSKTDLEKEYIYYWVDIHHNAFRYKKYTEKELYSWEQLAAELGGYLGLFIGASAFSVIEIIIYLFLCLFQSFVRYQEAQDSLSCENSENSSSKYKLIAIETGI